MKGMTHNQARELKQAIIQYRLDGHYAEETAQKFGVSLGYVYGASNGLGRICPQNREATRAGACEWSSKKQKETLSDREDKCREIISEKTPWFEYVSGYTDMNCRVLVKCKLCGYIDSRPFNSLRHGNGTCQNCKKVEAEKKEKERQERQEAQKRQAQQKREQKENDLAERTRTAKCEECGNIFKTRRTRQVCCSDECSKKRANRKTSHKKDARIAIDKRIDKDITVKKLYARDNGVCWICGEKCNDEDFSIVNGTIVCGNTYPSIDHVVPICDGGRDAWDNVRLAHRWCNSARYWQERRPPAS